MGASTELTRLGVVIGGLLGNIAGFVVMVVVGWLILKVLFKGGDTRAVQELVIRGILIGVAVAAIMNLGTTVGLVTSIGATIFNEVANAVRASL